MNTQQYNVGKLVEWILKHKKGKAFENGTVESVAVQVMRAALENVFLFSTDEKGEFNGVVCGTKDAENKVIYVYNILTTQAGVVKKFMKRFLEVYPDYAIEGLAHGRRRYFSNTQRLHDKL